MKLSPNKCLIIFPFLSATTFTAPQWWKYTRTGPLSVCAEWYMRFFFLRMVVYCVTAAKVMKRANSKVQSEDSCIVRHSIVKWRYMYVLPNVQGLKRMRSLRGKFGSKTEKLQDINSTYLRFCFWRS